MDCVKCNGQLIKTIIDDVEVDKCNSCSGIWFDFGELEAVLDGSEVEALKNEAANNEAHDNQKAHCPRCGGDGNMVQVKQMKHNDIHVDVCTVCYGRWLDGGELEKLQGDGLMAKIKHLFGH